MMNSNSLFLIGGGWRPEAFRLTYGPFVRAATRDSQCRVALLIVLEPDDNVDGWIDQFRSPFESLSMTSDQLPAFVLTKDHPLDIQALLSAEPTGIFVAGGLTPLYQELLCTTGTFRDYLLSSRLPYGGFSAGAAIAANRAVVGGWKLPKDLGGLPIVDEEVSENLEELTVRPGLGLVPFATDVHCGTWGTLTRLINAVAHGMVESGWGIDEDTMLEIHHGTLTIHGLGQAYHVERNNGGAVVINTFRPGDHIDLSTNR